MTKPKRQPGGKRDEHDAHDTHLGFSRRLWTLGGGALVTKGSLSYLSSPCFSKNVLQSGVGIVH